MTDWNVAGAVVSPNSLTHSLAQNCVLKQAKRSGKGCLWHILRFEPDLLTCTLQINTDNIAAPCSLSTDRQS